MEVHMNITKTTVSVINKGKKLALATVSLEDSVVINSIQVIQGEKGTFVAMPQYKDAEGKYHDIVILKNKELKAKVAESVLAEYAKKNK